ncbi:MAG TPA: beta-propeller fold lactonase family protein [Alphaproteobacteria bacterium]|nr:beta-propeller fold lactonase family protein [Alphaproteobacteria bacterium]
MRYRFLVFLALAAIIAKPALAGDPSDSLFDATTEIVGHNTNGLETPVNQLVTPTGIQVPLPGTRPNATALSPNGKLLVTSGLLPELIAIDPITGKILQRVPFPQESSDKSVEALSAQILNANEKAKLSFTGLVFSPNGSRIYLSNVNGDVKVFGVGPDGKISPRSSFPVPRVHVPERVFDIPTGIAVSPDGANIYVALNIGNKVVEMDATSGKQLRSWQTGNAPYDVVICRNKLYVSNWGGRLPDADSLTGPIGENGTVRVDARSVADEGSVSVIDLTEQQPGSGNEILTGRHACALALSPNRKFLAVANDTEDTISIIDTRSDKIIETLCARQSPGDVFGAQPNALAFDKRGRRLYVCNGSQNAVAVIDFKPGESKMLGLIPVGWFPCSINFDARHKMLDVANIEDIAPKMETPLKKKANGGMGFNSKQYYGSLSLVRIPSERQIEAFTETALADLRYPLLAQAKLPPRPGQPARPVPERVGEPSVFHHVIYFIKENRTYDQLLGDVREGNGDPDLCIYGNVVTPNYHKIVGDFTLLDNTYCSGILSATGHQWTDSGITTDYLEREFAGWPRSYPAGAEGGGRDALAYSPEGFIWTDASEHGKSVADFGEFTTARHWRKDSGETVKSWKTMYQDYVSGSNNIVYTAEPDIDSLRPFIVSNYVGFDLTVPDAVRADAFIKNLKAYEAADNFPSLVIVWLPNDHTSGTKPGEPTPRAMEADNDLAFGRIVDAVSHSKFWSTTCIFAIEDDPQDGWDHVSGYRTTAYVVSPYTRRHAVVHTQYNNTSLLRTMELILGIPPMTQMDATATPMFDCFTDTPDFAPYDFVINKIPLNEMNRPSKEIEDAALRKDSLISARLPLEKEDQCPEDLFNRILWRAAKGSKVPYPDQFVKAVPDDD